MKFLRLKSSFESWFKLLTVTKSLHIMIYNTTSESEKDCGGMVWEECGCQKSCATRHDANCTTCSPTCVCPPDTPYLHHGFCVDEEDCPEITAAGSFRLPFLPFYVSLKDSRQSDLEFSDL